MGRVHEQKGPSACSHSQQWALDFCLSVHLCPLCAVIQVDVIEMMYEKALRITHGVKSKMGVGSIVNLQSNDGSKIWNLPQYLHIVWNGPAQILVIMALLVRDDKSGVARSGHSHP